MSVGLGTIASAWLDTLRNVSYSETAVYVQLHTGDPGAAGTANVSSVTTRPAVTFSAAVAGSMAASNQPAWNDWGGATETITHISLWDAPTAGTFLWSIDSANGDIGPGENLILETLTLSIGPAAA